MCDYVLRHNMLAILIPFIAQSVWRVSCHGVDKFGTVEYWDESYKNGKYGTDKEWYDLSWDKLSPRLASTLPAAGSLSADVLVTGCGNSPNSAEMAKDKFAKRLVSSDFSPYVIDTMRERHPDLEWVVSDATTLEEFADSEFDFVFDKGALDAIRGSKSVERNTQVITAYHRVLRAGGAVILVTSCMEEECMPLLQKWFDPVEVVKIPKENLERIRAMAKRMGIEPREFDLMYISKVPAQKRTSPT